MEIRMQSEAQVRVQAVDKHAGELGNRSNTAPRGRGVSRREMANSTK